MNATNHVTFNFFHEYLVMHAILWCLHQLDLHMFKLRVCDDHRVYKLNANVHDGITSESVIVPKGHKLAIFLIFAKYYTLNLSNALFLKSAKICTHK